MIHWQHASLIHSLPFHLFLSFQGLNYNVNGDNAAGRVVVTGVNNGGEDRVAAYLKWSTLAAPLVYPGVSPGAVIQWVTVTVGINTTATPLWGGFTGPEQLSFVYGSDFRYRCDLQVKAAQDFRAHAEGTLFALDKRTGMAVKPSTITSGGGATRWNATIDSFVAGFGPAWQTTPAISVSNWGGAKVSVSQDQGSSLGTFGVQVHPRPPLSS